MVPSALKPPGTASLLTVAEVTEAPLFLSIRPPMTRRAWRTLAAISVSLSAAG